MAGPGIAPGTTVAAGSTSTTKLRLSKPIMHEVPHTTVLTFTPNVIVVSGATTPTGQSVAVGMLASGKVLLKVKLKTNFFES